MIKILSKLPFLLMIRAIYQFKTIRSKIKTIIFEQNQIGLVIIDYLQLMFKIQN